MTDPTKVLFIGLDSAEPELILQWTATGVLPVLRSLQSESAWGAVKTPPGFGNGAMWPSFFTGVNPGRHGRYYQARPRPGSYQLARFHEDTDFKHEPFWNVLSSAGRRVAVLDMVRAPLTENINGIQLAEWTTCDSVLPARSWPPTLAAEVADRFGTDPVKGTWEAEEESLEALRSFRDRMIERTRMKLDLSCQYLQDGPWDLFMTVFGDPHEVGHECWHLHDPAHPNYDAEIARQLGDPVKDIYVATDTALGELLAQVGPNTSVFVLAGPGIGTNYTGTHLMDRILRRLEGLPEESTSDAEAAPRGLRAMYRKFIPARIRKLVRSSALANRAFDAVGAHALSRRRYFTLPHPGISSAIRINLIGREPNGRVAPGAAYDALCDALTKDLLDLVNLDTGAPVIDEVIRVADVYHGECLDELPDLLAIWNPDHSISSVGSAKVGELHGTFPGRRSGGHTPRSMFFARGPTIKPGHLSGFVKVEDLAPTICSLLGIALPEVDGIPIEACGATV